MTVCKSLYLSNKTTDYVIEVSGKTSFTTDAWPDPNQTSFMAVTAYWIEAIEEETLTGCKKKKLHLRADLFGFHKLPG